MANKAIQKMQETADSLYEIRQRITKKEDDNRAELDLLKTERDAMQAILLADMNKNSLKSIKTKAGDSFVVGIKKGFEITNEAQAFGWAYENKAVSINKTIASQIIKEIKEIPPGFQLVETEFISIRKAKTNE